MSVQVARPRSRSAKSQETTTPASSREESKLSLLSLQIQTDTYTHPRILNYAVVWYNTYNATKITAPHIAELI